MNRQLLAFVVVSIFLGSTILALIPNRLEPPEIATAVVVGLVLWLFYSSFIHLLCRLLQGRGRFIETSSISLQLFGTLYVLGSILTLITSVLLVFRPIGMLAIALIPTLTAFSEDPIRAHFFFWSPTLLLLYLPLALKYVHGLRWHRQLIVAIPSVVTISIIGYSLYRATGLPVGLPPP